MADDRMLGPPAPAQSPPTATDAATLLRSRHYLQLLVIAAVLGVPVSAVAYWYLVLTGVLQDWLYRDLPGWLGMDSVPTWWPLPLLGIGGLLVALLIRYTPGRGGESPLEGFRPGGGPPAPLPLLGVALAALLSLGFGAVVGPEAPLIAIGGGSQQRRSGWPAGTPPRRRSPSSPRRAASWPSAPCSARHSSAPSC